MSKQKNISTIEPPGVTIKTDFGAPRPSPIECYLDNNFISISSFKLSRHSNNMVLSLMVQIKDNHSYKQPGDKVHVILYVLDKKISLTCEVLQTEVDGVNENLTLLAPHKPWETYDRTRDKRACDAEEVRAVTSR